MQSDLPLCKTQEVGKDNAKFRAHHECRSSAGRLQAVLCAHKVCFQNKAKNILIQQ